MEGQQPQESMVQLWHNFLWCQQVYWPALHSEHLRECSSKMWWGLLSLKGLEIFRLKLKAGDLIFYWLTWLSWRCLIVCAGDLCAPHPRAVHLSSNFMHWGLKNRNDLLWFICFLPLQPCENWLDYLGRCGRMSEEETDPGVPMWEGQPVLSALCCHTWGSWPYLPQSGTCSLLLGKWILSYSLTFLTSLNLSLVQSTHTVLGDPGRSCAWGGDEFCISTSVLQQVQSVEQATSQVCLYVIRW